MAPAGAGRAERGDICARSSVIAALWPILAPFSGALAVPSAAARTTAGCSGPETACWASTGCPSWASPPRGCSPLSGRAAAVCATARSMALSGSGRYWKGKAMRFGAGPTARSCSPCTGSMARLCLPCWTRSLPASSMTALRGSSSPHGTPSASGPSITGMTAADPPSLPVSQRTWWGSWSTSCRSRRDTITRTADLCATGTLPRWSASAGTAWTLSAPASEKSLSPEWKSGWSPTPRWAFSCPAGWTPPWCAPSPPGGAVPRSAPSPSAWTLTPST